MIEAAELLQVLELLEQGVLLVGARAFLLHANRAGSAILAAGDGILLRRGAVACRQSDETDRLRRTLSDREGAGRHALAVYRCAGPPFSIVVAPLGGPSLGGVGGPIAALLISDPERMATTSAVHLRDLYGLTPAECRTALVLLDAHRPQEVAARLAVSVNAVRVHLRHLFEKTGTRRQAELVRLLLAHRLPGIACQQLTGGS